jgi:hypothetical protein
MSITWEFVERIDPGNITDFETRYGFKFDEPFKKCVLKYNGGYPIPNFFDTTSVKTLAVKCLLSFLVESDDNIWDANEALAERGIEGVIAFAVDDFGNYICFGKSDNKVYFFDHETDTFVFVSDSFEVFLNSFRKQ